MLPTIGFNGLYVCLHVLQIFDTIKIQFIIQIQKSKKTHDMFLKL